jgi:hypothetical protein
LKLAAMACCKQYCLRRIRQLAETTSCIAWASFKTVAPKLSEALILLWLLSLYQDKESNMDFCGAENELSLFLLKNLYLYGA